MKPNLKILIVEDEPDLRDIFSDMLKTLGCQVSVATNGRTALLELQNNSFDALFTDMQMPEMDGLSLINAIHKLKLNKVPQIFIMTGRIDKDPRTDMDQSVARLIKNILPKPFSYKLITELIQNFDYQN